MIGFCLFFHEMKAQEMQPVKLDSLPNADNLFAFSDSLRNDTTLLLEGDSVYLAVDTAAFKPKPMRAVLFSAIVPGLGQIYNRKYWKLPLVYGSFIGCAYAVTWNNVQYRDYKRAFIDFWDGDETTNSWKDFVPRSFPANINDWSEGQKTWFSSSVLKAGKDYYRYYRDMSVIISVGVYALWIIDAYVDAQLFDFDVSPDLSMKAAPVFFEKTPVNSRSFGLQLSFTF